MSEMAKEATIERSANQGRRRPLSQMSAEEQIMRVKLPQGEEVFGVVEQRLGYSKMYVRCVDNKTRIGRIPGKYSRFLWVREGDLVLVKPWPVQAEKKADIIYRYSRAQWDWLVRNGKLPEAFM